MTDDQHNIFIMEAIELAKYSIDNLGGPFGAVVVKNGEIIARGHNQVTLSNDPTAHAEMVAIRNACNELSHYELDGCILYSSSEPCPMCLSAIYWARISVVYYANPHQLAHEIGFDDSFIYQELGRTHEEKKIQIAAIEDQSIKDKAKEIFHIWQDKVDKIPY